ncbi:MAG: diacylglycerol kinase family lipid kinase [Lewinellaceae bacterium]|nr:diacylglycerol kinase family lipid kinase [Lewinella sp.]MCB9277423.1 diacylglycerol kinase family lipid kinase [Lewinellaceae bacterium]
MAQADNNWFFIVNPVAGNGAAARRWPALERRLRQTWPDLEFAMTNGPGHAAQLAEEAVARGFRRIIAVGGDGINHEAANGILRQKHVPPAEITYCLLPFGTGNDWRRTHRIPIETEPWIAMVEAGHTTFQDVGLVSFFRDGRQDQRFFVNVAGLGYDGFVVRFVGARRSPVLNRLYYLFMIFRCLFLYKLRKARLTFDDRTVEDRFYTINAGIGRYSGGGMQLVPHAVTDDGLLALTYAENVSKWTVVINTWRFYNGSLGQHPRIHTHHCREIRVETAPGEMPTLVEADGEFLGETPVRISLLPTALKIIVPQKDNRS